MPGKVNPTIPEYLVQCCMQVCGRCYSVQMTLDHSDLCIAAWYCLEMEVTNLELSRC